MTQSTATSKPSIATHEQQCDAMEADPQSPMARATRIGTDIDDDSAPMMHSPLVDRTQIHDVDKLLVEASSVDGAADSEQATHLPHVSRFANLGLNSRPLISAVRKREPCPKFDDDDAEKPSLSTSYQRKWMQGEGDLSELETLLIPAGLRQAYRDGGALPMDPRPLAPTCKSSKYSTGFLTESGWHPVNNDEWKIASQRDHTDQDLTDGALANGLLDYDDLPGELAKANTVIHKPPNKTDFGAVVAELVQDAGTPLVDEKYFDLDNYLEHAWGSGKRRTKKGSPAKSSRKEVTKTPMIVVPGPIERSPRKGSNEKAGKNPKLPKLVKRKTDVHRKAPTRVSSSDGSNFSRDEKLAVGVALGESAVTSNLVQAKSSDFDATSVTILEENDTVHRNTEQSHKPDLKRTHRMYLPIEEAWLTLFHKKIKLVVEAGHNVKLAGPTATMEHFNDFFVGKILRGPGGENLPPRGARDETSMKGKLYHVNSGIKPLRDVIRKLTEGKHGGVMCVPIITEDELQQYQEKGTVKMDDPAGADETAATTDLLSKRKREIVDVEGMDEKRVKQ
jgi:hypothetical protein